MIIIEDKYTVNLEIVSLSMEHIDNLSRMKLSPVLEMIKLKDEFHSFNLCEAMLELDRLRNIVVIHSEDEDRQSRFEISMKVYHLLENIPFLEGEICNI
jgi:hypothetical protein